MKTLYVVTRADLGGAQVHLLDLIRGMQGKVDPAVAVGEKGFLTEELDGLGVPYFLAPSLVQPVSPSKDVRALFEVTRIVRQVQPDLVHAHTSKAGVIGRLAAWCAGVPSVFTAHTWCFSEGRSWKWRLGGIPAERLAALHCSTIINVSEANRTLALENGIATGRKLVTIPNGIADSPHRAHPGEAGTATILMVARCVPQKNHRLLLDAFARTNRKGRILLVGDGPLLESLKRHAVRRGIERQVAFLGNRSDIAEVAASAQIFALASHWEGLPLSILEAMRAGLPVIATGVGGVAEAIEDGANGYLIPRGDVDVFARRLSNLLQDPDLRRRMGEESRRRYESKFTLGRMIHKTLAVYSNAVHLKHAAAGSRAAARVARAHS